MVSEEQEPRPYIRRAQRVLQMVHELHKQGYQRLRIAPGMSPSDNSWRCSITPTANILATHGALLVDAGFAAHYTSAMDNNYFDWKDAAQNSARHLAAKFIQRYPEIAKAGLGSDWSYAGWYVEMLGFAEEGEFPVAYADWCGEPPTYLAKLGDRELPFPPPGEAEDTT